MRKASTIQILGATAFLSAALIACSGTSDNPAAIGSPDTGSDVTTSVPSAEQVKNEQAFSMLTSYKDSDGNAVYSPAESAILAKSISIDPNIDLAAIQETVSHLRSLIETHRGQEELPSPNNLYDSKSAMQMAIKMEKHGISLDSFKEIFAFLNIGVRELDANGNERGFALEVNEAARATDSLIDRTIAKLTPDAIFANDFNLTSISDKVIAGEFQKELNVRIRELKDRYRLVSRMQAKGSDRPLLSGRESIAHILVHAMDSDSDYLNVVRELRDFQNHRVAEEAKASELKLELIAKEAELANARRTLGTQKQALAGIEHALEMVRKQESIATQGRDQSVAGLETANDLAERVAKISSELDLVRQAAAQAHGFATEDHLNASEALVEAQAEYDPLDKEANRLRAILDQRIANNSSRIASARKNYLAAHGLRHESAGRLRQADFRVKQTRERLRETEARLNELNTQRDEARTQGNDVAKMIAIITPKLAEFRQGLSDSVESIAGLSEEKSAAETAIAAHIDAIKGDDGLEAAIQKLREAIVQSEDRIMVLGQGMDEVHAEIQALRIY